MSTRVATARRLLCTLVGLSLPAQWDQVAAATSPAAQAGAAMAFSLTDSATLLFGTDAAAAAAFWSWDGADWTRLQPPSLPPYQRGAAMTYDLQHAQTVLFGGFDQNGQPNGATWLWDGATWTAAPGGPQVARAGMTYDLTRNRVVVFGGVINLSFVNTISSETWEWDGSNWALMPVPGPFQRERVAMCHLGAIARTVLFGGLGPTGTDDETWLYDGGNWLPAAITGPRPAPRIDAQLVEDANRGVCILTGGMTPDGFTTLDDCWEFDGVAWRQVAAVISPPRSQAAIAYDWFRGRAVLFGGRTASGAMRSDTWEYGASHHRYGNGCIGSFGRPALVGGAAPRLGATASVTLVNLDPNAAFAAIALGGSRTQWAFGALPASLAFVGMPGCVAYQSTDELRLLPAAGGAAVWTFAVPSSPHLFGARAYLQGLSFDSGRNAAGLVTSDGDQLTLGW